MQVSISSYCLFQANITESSNFSKKICIYFSLDKTEQSWVSKEISTQLGPRLYVADRGIGILLHRTNLNKKIMSGKHDWLIGRMLTTH